MSSVSNPGFALRNWFSSNEGYAVVLGPISLHVTRIGSMWRGEVRTVASNVGITLASTNKYKNLGYAQRATQDLAKEILTFTSDVLESLSSSVTQLPKA